MTTPDGNGSPPDRDPLGGEPAPTPAPAPPPPEN